MKLMIHLLNESFREPVSNLLTNNPLQALVTGPTPVISSDFSHILSVDSSGLSLRENTLAKASATRVDFLEKRLQYRLATSGRSQGIARAIGIIADCHQSVVDATAGLGKDAFILASLGCELSLLERSNIIFALLEDGMKRGYQDGDISLKQILDKMKLYHLDALDYFKMISTGLVKKPDVIYLDPMFPPRSKSAKVKKDILMLQQVLETNEGFNELLSAALPCAIRRVVVKRPGKHSKHNTEIKPSFQIKGKSAHFDVYLTQQSS